MKNRRDILLLLLAIAGLAIANIWLFSNENAVASRAASLVDAAGDATAIEIVRPSATTTLRREGRDWRIVSPFAGRADERMVMKLLDTVSATPAVDRHSESELAKLGRTRADFGLESSALMLRLEFSSDAPVEITFGALTPDNTGTYAARSDSSSVFVVPKAMRDAVDVSAAAFRSRALLVGVSERTDAFDVRRGPGSVLKFKRQDNGWHMGNQKSLDDKVSRFLGDLTEAEAESFVWPVGASNESERASAALLAGYGLDPDTAVTVTLKGSDGTDRQVAFGCEAGEGLFYALAQNGGAIVTVKSSLRDQAVQDEGFFVDASLFAVSQDAVGSFSFLDGDVLYSVARGVDGRWSFESPISAPADQDVVQVTLSRILSLSSADVVEKGGLVLSVATNLPSVRVAASAVFGTGRIEDLRAREMIRIDPSLVKRIVRTAGKTSSSVLYDRERAAWNVETETAAEGVVDAAGIASVLAALNPLTALRVERVRVQAADLDDYGLDAPSFTIAVDRLAADSVRRNILVGAVTSGGRYATVGSSDAVFVISDETVKKLTAPISASVP